MSLCKHANIFGKPAEGAHSYRIGGARGTTQGIALVDTAMTVVLAIILTVVTKKRWYWIFLYLLVLLIVAFFVHKLFCVKTSMTTFIDKI